MQRGFALSLHFDLRGEVEPAQAPGHCAKGIRSSRFVKGYLCGQMDSQPLALLLAYQDNQKAAAPREFHVRLLGPGCYGYSAPLMSCCCVARSARGRVP